MTQQATPDQQPALQDDTDDSQACGEGMCQCSCGYGHPCGCDCPRCPYCQQLDDHCDCDD